MSSSQVVVPTLPALAQLNKLRSFLEERVVLSDLQSQISFEVHCGEVGSADLKTRVLESAGSAHLVLRPPTDSNTPVNLLLPLVTAWKDVYEGQERELLLLEELAVDWESLQALYDLSSDLQSSLTHDEMLRRILSRAAAPLPGSSAMLLLERAGDLVPFAWFNTPEPGLFSGKQGLVGRVVRDQNALVLNDPVRIAATPGLESPWTGATSVALAPITTPHRGLFGMIALWSRNPQSSFNSHLVRLLEALGQQAALIVESDRLGRTVRESERLQQEIQIGSLIQQTLLLGDPPLHHPHVDLATLNLPSQTVDGDFMDVYPRNDGGMEVLVGDVMGKGIPAALIGAATKSHVLRAIAETGHAVATGGVHLDGIINIAAARMTPHLQALDRFVTLCFALVDPAHHSVQWVDCGHTATIHYHAKSGTTTEMKGEGLPMGVLESEVYKESSENFQFGDLLLFYSDGVTEAKNSEGEMFGEERLSAVVREFASHGSAVLLDAVRRGVVAFSGSETFGDDFTCLAVRLLPEDERPLLTSSIVLGSTLAELPRFYTWCKSFLAAPECRLESEIPDLIHLALTEAFTNIIRHGYREQPGKQVVIHGIASASRLQFEIEDDGQAWDPSLAAAPVFDGSKSGGFGLFIIDQVMDRRFYLRLANNRNRLQLIRFHNSQNPMEREKS